MLLTIDVGNSNITLGVYEKDVLYFVSRMATDQSRMEDQYAIEIRDILDIYDVNRDHIDGAIISSVVPKLTEYISRAIVKLFGVTPFVVSHNSVKDLKVDVPNEESVGADLVAGCTAARELYSCPCIVVDMGTASTLMVMDKDERLMGGCIIPGLGISLDALVNRAALLSSVSFETPPFVVGRSSRECIQSGMIYGSASMLDGLCDRIEEELGYPCRVIATGGMAQTVIKNCKRKVEYSDTLVLDGLKIIYERLRKQ